MFQVVSIAAIVLLTVIDRITKSIVCKTIMVNGPVKFFGGLFQFRYVENTGAAFSSFSDNTLVLIVFTVLIIFLCLFILLTKKINSKFANVCLVLIVSGGIGNVIDRITNGFVVDFIEPLFVNFAVFNFADCCITVGAFLIIGYEIKELIAEKRKPSQNDEGKYNDSENN